MIKTQRLSIRLWTPNNAIDFYQLSCDEGFNLFPITIYRQQNLQSAIQWIEKAISIYNDSGNLGKYAVWEKSSGELIGLGGLTPWEFEGEKMTDITYRIKQSVWGKGYGIELAQALVNHGFENKNLQEITATITPDNFVSKRIAEKLGMKINKTIVLLGVKTDLYRISSSQYSNQQ